MDSNDKEALLHSIAHKTIIDSKQIEMVHQLHQAAFKHILTEILDEYGLQQRLEATSKAGSKINILDIGCGEGLYLHDVAAVLEERHLLNAANCFGIDINPDLISIATEYASLVNPPRPYLYFYQHNATKPLTDSALAKIHGVSQFDFIYAINVLQFLPNAQEQLTRFYAELKPGGVLYLRNLVLHKGADGWLPAHQALEPLEAAFFGKIAEINPGVNIAEESVAWLKKLKAEQIRQEYSTRKDDRHTPQGLLQIRARISMIHEKIAPLLIKQGLLSQAAYDKIWAEVSHQPSLESDGQVGVVHILARKPIG